MYRWLAYSIEIIIGALLLAGIVGYLMIVVRAWRPVRQGSKVQTRAQIWRWRIITLIGLILGIFVIQLYYFLLLAAAS